MFRPIAAAAVGVVLAVSASSPARSQTIYAPVQYQYGEQGNRYYYGGSDPAVFEMAERRACLDRISDHPYTSERYNHAYLHRRLIGRLDRVYSDCVPYMNARVFGYLPVDAANEANANVPRYFRMADLERAAVEMPDGSRVVPAQAQPVVIDDDDDRDGGAATRPAIKPRAIIIIKKAKGSDKLVASAAK
jgi:hypothetical protein